MSDSDTNLPSVREKKLERVLADYLYSVESGRPLDRSSIIAAHPDLADDLLSFFRNRDSIQHLAAPLRAAVVDTPTLVGMLPFEPAASTTVRAEAQTSGPMPSPAIKTTGVANYAPLRRRSICATSVRVQSKDRFVKRFDAKNRGNCQFVLSNFIIRLS